jgi:hypothetical protein
MGEGTFFFHVYASMQGSISMAVRVGIDLWCQCQDYSVTSGSSLVPDRAVDRLALGFLALVSANS